MRAVGARRGRRLHSTRVVVAFSTRWYPRRVRHRLLLVTALLAASACKPEAEVAEAVIDRGPGPTDPLGAALHRVVRARAGRLEEIGTERRGTLGQGLAEEALVLHGGYCYAIFVQAEPSAGELALRLLDDRHEPINVDTERGASAILGLAEPLCAERATPVRLELDADSGGAYALRIFRATAI